MRRLGVSVFRAADSLQKASRYLALSESNFDPQPRMPIPTRGRIEERSYSPRKSSARKGIFSELTSLMQDLARVREPIEGADFSGVFQHNSTPGATDLFKEIFFAPTLNQYSSTWLGSAHELHHSVYRDLPWREIRPAINAWFRLRPEIQDRALATLWERRLRPDEVLAVNLRGSRKHTEIPPTPVEVWVKLVGDLLLAYAHLTVVVFSDDQDLVDDFADLAPFTVVDLGQEVRTRANSSIVRAFRSQTWTSDFTKNFVGRTWLISQCHVVVTHTGNGAFWTALFRGCTCRFFQFTRLPGSVSVPQADCDLHS